MESHVSAKFVPVQTTLIHAELELFSTFLCVFMKFLGFSRVIRIIGLFLKKCILTLFHVIHTTVKICFGVLIILLGDIAPRIGVSFGYI